MNGFFLESNVRFECSAMNVTKEQLAAIIPLGFNGDEYFIHFYLENNGGRFPDGARFCRDDSESSKDGYTSVEIESFYFIPAMPEQQMPYLGSIFKRWNARIKHLTNMSNFVNSHFPFASDASGNDYWIDLKTGRVKYICFDSDPSYIINVAPSFFIFCKGICAGI
ncbi:SMI1/KNR4 family protein [Escherichia coli]|uniref:SMI1/KNR4 family protein n=1 Tax=Escherichia sp. MOD1-EC7003 TaxID=2093900 RepID=UPI000CF7AA78|nr:SMI1/KNR4 family protein [Escherichia sp. MOD1-EC7003]EGO8361699.1 SMI1/KNR4 family protein [Escherichia coli]EGO8379688.1 SMI1/KNR4 family protein [Escherichia coli]MCH0694524.1 SMI1/KNR4 family protein [Escherichia coli]